jgi:dinuclear metal center YbgI/SA1388 family protein
MNLKNIVNKLDTLIPNAFADAKDNTGLQVGDLKNDVKKILIALETTSEVLDHAIKNKIDLIITHHPVIFMKVGNVTSRNTTGKFLLKAIENKIAIYSIHTNADAIKGGINDYLADLLDMKPGKPLEYTDKTSLVKLVTFIPAEKHEEVREKLLDSGIGKIGEYSHCSFNIEGEGTYLPTEGTTPYKGKAGTLEKAKEVRFETILFNKDVNNAISLLKSVHPYEEVAYDLYPLKNNDGKPGIGRLCKPNKKVTLKEILKNLPEQLDIDFVRFNGDENKSIQKVAICTGSGGSFLYKLSNIDLMITGDISFHHAMDALEKNIAFIDIGHDQEKIFIPFMKNKLESILSDTEVIGYTKTINPFRIKNYKEN